MHSCHTNVCTESCLAAEHLNRWSLFLPFSIMIREGTKNLCRKQICSFVRIPSTLFCCMYFVTLVHLYATLLHAYLPLNLSFHWCWKLFVKPARESRFFLERLAWHQLAQGWYLPRTFISTSSSMAGLVPEEGGRHITTTNYRIAGGLKLSRISRFCSCLQVFSMKLGSVASFGNDTSEQSTQVFSLKDSHYMMVCSDNLPRTMDVSHKNGSVD